MIFIEVVIYMISLKLIKAKNFSVLKEKLIKGINYLDLNNVIDKTNLSKEFWEKCINA